MNKHRYIENDLVELCFNAGKMAFISGPRQAGKTTLAKALLNARGVGHYYNWDEAIFRRMWAKDPKSVIDDTAGKKKPLIILDEIHKAKLWKRNLKGIYDTLENPTDILVTGSARLNVYRKSSDSLLGRYYHFRLHPFSLAELCRYPFNDEIDLLLERIFSSSLNIKKTTQQKCQLLERFGPFPEPLFTASPRTLNLWQQGRVEKLIREDLRDISQLPELSQVEMLVALLPERVGCLLSVASLAQDLEVAHTTVTRWLNYLKSLYYMFEIKPYDKVQVRSLRKAKKAYLWDWSEIEDEGARFENMIASHLLKYCDYLTDTGYAKCELFFLRNKEQQEIDFLIVKNKKPWFPVEVKLGNQSISKNFNVFMKHLPCKRAIQVVKTPNVFKCIEKEGYEVLVISAEKLLSYLV